MSDWGRLRRARSELAAARLLLENDMPEAAVSRSYFAAFHAATAALDAVGQRTKTHAGLISVFGREVVDEGGFDPAIAKTLAILLAARNDLDYGIGVEVVGKADAAVEDAERFVDAVDGWITARG